MNCEQATRLLSEGQDRPLTASERTVLRLHTWICEGCRNFGGQLGFIRHAVRGFAARGADERNPQEPLASPDNDPGPPRDVA